MPQTQRDTSGEIPEVAWRGPFGGIQSEIPLDGIEGIGWADAVNFIFRRSRIDTRPGYTMLPALPAPSNQKIVGIADFFDKTGNRVQVVMTTTRLIKWDATAQNWVVIGGPNFTGTVNKLFNWSVLNYQLAFCQGTDQVMLWDGSAPYAPAAAGVPPARFLSEISFHLMLGYTTELGTERPQRVRWSASFDPTDYTSATSGFADLTNDLGPITGIANVYQTGFIFQQRGIVQVIPTGIGIQPFDFIKISNKAKGNIAPQSLAYYGDQMACYVGKDNIYMFDGTQSYPIGDMPIDGNRRIGARSRIYGELKLADLSQVVGFITSSIGGNPFNAYWLVIPNGSVWVYFFDEQCWTRFLYDQTISTIGDFAKNGIVEIKDLIGTIAQQSWSFDDLTNDNPLDDFGIGFSAGGVGYVDFSQMCESPASLISGSIRCNDSRHNKYARRARTIQTDVGMTTYTLTLTNESGQTLQRTMTNGSGSGASLEQLFDESIKGMFLTVQLDVPAGMPTSFSEIALLYDTAGEYRGI